MRAAGEPRRGDAGLTHSHRLQAWLITTMVREGKRRAIVMEMLTEAQEQALNAKRATAPNDPNGWAEAVDWEGSGWPRYSLYRPIFEVAAQFDDVDTKQGDSLIAFGWAMAESLAKLN